MDQTSIFEFIYPKYQVDKPIRLIEFFAGYGSQALALKYLGVPFEHWKICEWNYKSFQAYKQLHMGEDHTDYSKGKTKDELVEYLSAKGISSNWNEPMKQEQIKRLGEDKLREIYNNIQATHNLVDISQVHGSDLEINDTGYTYILTYSFPCQDLSLAGLRQGMNKGDSTRSGLLWEVERILHELKECGHLPDVLLMENVPQVHGADNMENFKDWQLSLEKLGYSNYWQDLIATDYGIPQIRNRCFMISILGEYHYNFPLKIELTKRLKDLLESEVDESYYLSERAIAGIKKTTFSQTTLEARTQDKAGCIPTLAARDYKDPKLWVEPKKHTAYMINSDTEYAKTIDTQTGNQTHWAQYVDETKPKVVGNVVTSTGKIHQKSEIYDTQAIAPTLIASNSYDPVKIAIKNATKQGYLEAEEGDGIDISSRMEHHRGTVQKGLSQTLSCAGGGTQGVIVNGKNKNDRDAS